MKLHPALLLFALPVVLSELTAHFWMNPRASRDSGPLLELRLPEHERGWTVDPELYREVVPSLRCSSGWIAEADGGSRPGMRVAYFKWDRTHTVNTLEAFKHMPEQCMGAVGMDLEKVHPRRRLEHNGHRLVFDSTLFRPRGGGQAVHVFKCVWVSGIPDTDLRGDVLMGSTGKELRRLRVSAALTRFKPSHTRVIMGSVVGMPSEALAWARFSDAVAADLVWLPGHDD